MKRGKNDAKLREIGTNAIAYELGKAGEQKRILGLINEWLKERTYQSLKIEWIRFMPFEWEEFKAKIKGEEK